MTTRLAKENDYFENQISYKRSNMEKMRTQRNYLEEQIQRFKEEIVQLRLMEIKEAQRQQREMEIKQVWFLHWSHMYVCMQYTYI